jgi:uncharacterized membrane protein
VNPLIPIHIAGGTVALIAGGAGLFLSRKGSRLHARVGTVFFAGMLVLGGTGAVIAALAPERGTAVIGLLTCYLVLSSWATARNRAGTAGRFELYGFGVALACALTMLSFGLLGLSAPDGRTDSLPAAVHFPFAALAALAAALDLNFILRRQLSARQRLVRHLWRMCTALLIAAFSFFLGQQKVMPEAIQGSPWLFAPPLATLAAMIFWIFRIRFRPFDWARARRPTLPPMARDPAPAEA